MLFNISLQVMQEWILTIQMSHVFLVIITCNNPLLTGIIKKIILDKGNSILSLFSYHIANMVSCNKYSYTVYLLTFSKVSCNTVP